MKEIQKIKDIIDSVSVDIKKESHPQQTEELIKAEEIIEEFAVRFAGQIALESAKAYRNLLDGVEIDRKRATTARMKEVAKFIETKYENKKTGKIKISIGGEDTKVAEGDTYESGVRKGNPILRTTTSGT